ncbi:MAG TPA: glycine cleavage T C-terminal barrel domain-containing protein [Rhizomicrobium sp.]|nr:glycine cleavage T C-terminal barrel domain-containing protein [Rhizomicrobium sp.]
MSPVRATPFHVRAADANEGNLWRSRNGFTLAASYGGVASEAAAARLGVAMADISWRWRVTLEGARVRELMQRLFTCDASGLAPGRALKALWLADGGGVRGAGVVACHGRQSFQLISAGADHDWIAGAASAFGCTLRDITEEEGGVALVGPYAAKLVAALGLDPTLEPVTFRRFPWRSVDVTLSRFGEQGGYELWCKAEDAPIVWDRVMRAGEPFAILPAGLDAMDVLDIEAGVPRPGRDYDAATDGTAAEPIPGAWRLESLIDPEHQGFNGARAARAATPREQLVGLIIDSTTPSPFTPVMLNGKPVGRTLSSVCSPVLRRAIALAQIETALAVQGTAVSLVLPASRALLPTVAAAHIVDLPFLPPPDPIAP